MKRDPQRLQADAPAARLWLVRHAHALDGADDAARPLSAKGRTQVKRLAGFLRKSDAFAPAEIWHSPLVRARQTAELLAQRMKIDPPLRAVGGLVPGSDPAVMARRFARAGHIVALVGHEPHLSALASLLIAGAAKPAVFEMKKCGVLALERADGRWRARWHLSPELFA